jgi:uncharacterized protein YlxW (UPF0749 family)
MMLEPQIVISVVAAVVSAGIGVMMGRNRGVDQVARRADTELRKLVDALSARAELLENENETLKAKVFGLEARIGELEHDLRLERAVTMRIRNSVEADS